MPFDLLLEQLDPHVGSTPQREVPVLAQLSRRLIERPLYLHDQPLEVDSGTWKQARDEMVGIQRDRGFPLASANISQANFLLRGVPVVINDV